MLLQRHLKVFFEVTTAIVTLFLTYSTASKCCYSDACNSKTICSSTVSVQSILTDSCGVTYNVNPSTCALSPTRCCYRDACDKRKRICAMNGDTIIDTCNKTYRVDKTIGSCKLELQKRCCYFDACGVQRKKICGLINRVLTDACGNSYTITYNSKSKRCGLVKREPLVREPCCYSDACDSSRICAPRGGKLDDSCRNSYSVSSSCKLSFIKDNNKEIKEAECCYLDACDKAKRICSQRGGILPDSCGRSYEISEESCKLTGLQCCADDKCGAKTRRVCTQIGFDVAFAAKLLPQHDLFCTGFRDVVAKCLPNRNRLEYAAAGATIILATQLRLSKSELTYDIIKVGGSEWNNIFGDMRNVFPRFIDAACVGHRCAVKVIAKSARELRKKTIVKALKWLLPRQDWSQVFKRNKTPKVVSRSKHGRHFVIILEFKPTFLDQSEN